MLELPEVVTIVRQMQTELIGKQIASAVFGASPHKFAFFNLPPVAMAEALHGRTVTSVTERAAYIVVALDGDAVLLLGDLGGRILYHRSTTSIPLKHQLLVSFSDGSALTVSIALWGGIRVVPPAEMDKHIWSIKRMSPLSPDFTFDTFRELLADPVQREKKSVKLFMISKPGLAGIGNGCLQDILFRARLNPRRRIAELTEAEQRALYDATCTTIRLMVEQGGRDSELDLYGQAGGYPTILGSMAAGRPCPSCGTAIVKAAYLGGAVYFCPTCQP